MEDRNRNYWK